MSVLRNFIYIVFILATLYWLYTCKYIIQSKGWRSEGRQPRNIFYIQRVSGRRREGVEYWWHSHRQRPLQGRCATRHLCTPSFYFTTAQLENPIIERRLAVRVEGKECFVWKSSGTRASFHYRKDFPARKLPRRFTIQKIEVSEVPLTIILVYGCPSRENQCTHPRKQSQVSQSEDRQIGGESSPGTSSIGSCKSAREQIDEMKEV